MKIAFVTSEQWPDLAADDRLAVDELARRGVQVSPAVWTRVRDWTCYDLVVLRSCWDYHQRIAEFDAWIVSLERAGVRMLNPAATVRWNLDKRYLIDLAAAGASVIDTVIPSPGERLHAIMHERGWRRAVLKPRVSADGHRTAIVVSADAESQQAQLDELVAGPGALVQEYVEQIGRTGELSLIYIGGRYSHCVLKRPAAGEFRVQSRFGGTAEPYRADPELVSGASRILHAAGQEYGYARVDGCIVNGELKLMELELIEPSLFLDLDEGAAARFADHVMTAAA